MSKREHIKLNGGSEDIDGSRTKRRREVQTAVGSSSDVDVTMSDPAFPEESGEEKGNVEPEVVKLQGMKLWQTIKDAVNKEGRSLSIDFLRKPSKRLYPDYYQVISQPIALDDIKKQIEAGEYTSFDAIRQDFDLCFSNAKQYNMKDSEIWKDAKELLKLVNKTYNKLDPTHEIVDGEDGKKLKAKSPNLSRLIKSRLQKLVDKTDKTGRVISAEFMELPSKKEWPLYYKEIKKPQCLENIFKRIKRKEYHTAGDFAADVELVFSNAMTFNQEHTPIWEDALTLRDTFRQLMADLPDPYTLPEYAKTSNNKIKIKPQAAHASATLGSSSQTVQQNTGQASSPLLLRVPGTNMTGTPTVKEQLLPASRLPAPKSPSLPAALPLPPTGGVSPLPTTVKHTKSATPQPQQTYTNTSFSHYPNAGYTPPIAGTSVPSPANQSVPVPTPGGPRTTSSTRSSPTSGCRLRSMVICIQPCGRILDLDYSCGVRTWALRLARGETSICLRNVVLFGEDGEDGESGALIEEEEEDEEASPIDQEEKESDIEVDNVPVKPARRRGRGRGRGRAGRMAATTRAATNAASKSKMTAPPSAAKKKMASTPVPPGELQVKLNRVVVKERGSDADTEWDMVPTVGMNIIEVGEVGGITWKVYVERVGQV